MAMQLQIRRDSSTRWSSINPILAQGELGLELNTGKIKVGDGIKTWNLLTYITSPLESMAANLQAEINYIRTNTDPTVIDSLTEIVANVNALLANNVESQLVNSGYSATLTTTGNLVLDGSLLPNVHITHDLGSSTKAWRSLFLSSSTAYFGNAALTITSNGLQVLGANNESLPIIANIKFPDGSSLTSSSDGSGNVTFDNIIIQGVSGHGGLYLSPDSAMTANLMYFRIRPGNNPTDLYFDIADNTVYDQYFGDHSKYLKLEAGNSGNVLIGTTGLNWKFDTDGNLTLPLTHNVSPAPVSQPGITFSDGTFQNTAFEYSLLPNFGNLAANIIPAANVTYDLGSATRRWRDLYLSSNSIDLGGKTLSISGNNLSLGGDKFGEGGNVDGVAFNQYILNQVIIRVSIGTNAETLASKITKGDILKLNYAVGNHTQLTVISTDDGIIFTPNPTFKDYTVVVAETGPSTAENIFFELIKPAVRDVNQLLDSDNLLDIPDEQNVNGGAVLEAVWSSPITSAAMSAKVFLTGKDLTTGDTQCCEVLVTKKEGSQLVNQIVNGLIYTTNQLFSVTANVLVNGQITLSATVPGTNIVKVKSSGKIITFPTITTTTTSTTTTTTTTTSTTTTTTTSTSTTTTTTASP